MRGDLLIVNIRGRVISRCAPSCYFGLIVMVILSGQELLDKFKEARRQIRPAVERLLSEVRLAAKG